jgi:hypothetical protein
MPGLEALTHDGCPRWPGETRGRTFHAYSLDFRPGWWLPDLARRVSRFERSATVSLIDHDEFGVLVVGGGITRSPEGAAGKPRRHWPASPSLRHGTLRSMNPSSYQSDHGKMCRQGDDQCRGRGQCDQS